VNPSLTLATAVRVAAQLRRDPRTMALIFVVPPALLSLLHWMFTNQSGAFARIAAPMVGLFPLTIMFLITSIAMLRERTSGTLERLMSLPIGKLDLLLGYGMAFAALATLQAGLTAAVTYGLLGLHTAGPAWAVVLIAVATAILGTSLGLFLSAFARTEFQAVQFMPAVIIPQLLLAGLFIPRDLMPSTLQAISGALPFTYAFDGLTKAAANDFGVRLWVDVAVLLACTVGTLLLAATTLRRRTA
jgi:ABC-2 type transport system permease protein